MKINFCLLMVICALGVCTPGVVAAAERNSSSSSADDILRELEILDSLIESHLEEAEEINGQAPVPPPVPPAPEPVAPPAPAPAPRETPRRPIEVYTPPSPAPMDDITVKIDELDREIKERVRVSGRYRMAAGFGRNRTFSINDSNSELQDRNSNYLFGERLNNTYDPAIYSQFLVDIEADLTDKASIYTQLVADPWSYVGKTSEFTVPEAAGSDSLTLQLKYWGPNNSTIDEIYRAAFRNQISVTGREIHGGSTQEFTVTGIADQGLSYTVPRQEIDFEFRPLRKLWLDYEETNWHVRAFALADQDQVMRTDDPLILSNNKDFWQPSPWLATWVPVRIFADAGAGGDPDIQGAIERGHYSDTLVFNARTSYHEYLTLLRGVSLEIDFGRTYLGGMIASPYGPWDEYQEFNNIPGVLRMKHMVTPRWMVGGLYGFRMGLIDREPDAFNQVISVDTRYALTPEIDAYAQIAGSRDEIDRLAGSTRRAPLGLTSDKEGMAYRGGVEGSFEHPDGGATEFKADVAWMDTDFRPHLSRYDSTKDDNFWGRHITFHEYTPDLEYFRLGTGLDVGRTVARVTARSEAGDGRWDNLFDMRHVRSTDKASFIENVVRDEATYEILPGLKAKGFTRWVLLPRTETDVEPHLTDFLFLDGINLPPPDLQNNAIEAGLDPSRVTFAGGLQYELNDRWTFEASYTHTNDIPDFPRALQNDVFLAAAFPDPEDPHILIDKVQKFLYNQEVYGLPPYNFFSIVKEKVIFQPNDSMKWTFHAAQNSYKFWGPIDEMVNHQGISLDYQFNDRVSLFMDYTHSMIADIPHWIGSSFTDMQFRDHHNVYANLNYKVNDSTNLVVQYGVFGPTPGQGTPASPTNPFAVTEFSLPTIDTEQLIRISLEGEF